MAKKQPSSFDLLPDIFKTDSNKQFLSATLDQLTSSPKTAKINGYIGSKFGVGTSVGDSYLNEPTSTRQNYQLTPSIVTLDSNNVKDVISYPSIVETIRSMGAPMSNESESFSNEFYAFDSFVDMDKLVNFSQYCWLPQGPVAIEITASTVDTESVITLTNTPIGYTVAIDNIPLSGINPPISLVRGGRYVFQTNNPAYIQGSTTGYDLTNTNISSKTIYGIDNNGTQNFVFNVPYATAQDTWDKPGNLSVDLVSTKPYAQLNNVVFSSLGYNIDGVTDIDNKTILLYSTESASAKFYTINLAGDINNPVVQLIDTGTIPVNQRITVKSGDEYSNVHFFKDSLGEITKVPYLSSRNNTLYYADSSNVNAIGQISIVTESVTEVLDITEDILNKKTFISKNNVVFSNGMKVYFTGDVFPVEYRDKEYYVEGVGTAIKLIPVSELEVVEEFANTTLTGYDVYSYDQIPFDGAITSASTKDYITINRASIDRNAWARSNRWFHIDVVASTARYTGATAAYNQLNDPTLRAKRPIVEFYADLRLFNSGNVGKKMVDYFITSTSRCFVNVKTVDVVSTTAPSTITLQSGSGFAINQMVVFQGEAFGSLLADTPYFVNSISGNNITLRKENNTLVTVTTDSSVLTTLSAFIGDMKFGSQIHGQTDITGSPLCYLDINIDNPINPDCSVFDGARIVVASDTVVADRTIILEAVIAQTDSTKDLVVSLRQPIDSVVATLQQVPVRYGFVNKQNTFYNNGGWIIAQDKKTANQPPLFDVFDSNLVSFSNKSLYPASTFIGSKLFGYAIGTGTDDVVLKFPVKYTTLNNIGDIEFKSYFGSDSFAYTKDSTVSTKELDDGFVLSGNTKLNGWVTAYAESIQYQIHESVYPTDTKTIKLDVSLTTSAWPNVKVYLDGFYITAYTVSGNTIEFKTGFTKETAVQVYFISNTKSNMAYYDLPLNLTNNPFNINNDSLTTSDLRQHYASMYENAKITGEMYGSNNYRDLGNIVRYGSKLVQHSASLINTGLFLRTEHNLPSAIEHSSNEYVSLKSMIADLATRIDIADADVMLDNVLEEIASVRSESSAFYWSDMMPSRDADYISEYTFGTGIDTSKFRLAKTYDLTTASYDSVLVYITREVNGILTKTQLFKDIDYTVSSTSPYLSITADLIPDDIITIKEYSASYGSYIPSTPAKFGFVASSKPQVYLDTSYMEPTYVMKGHDGSISRLYGDYSGTFQDVRDAVMYEFECRIFNNIKATKAKYSDLTGFISGAYRSVNRLDYMQMYTTKFMNWVGKNRIDFRQNIFQRHNSFTWNYRDAIAKNGSTIPSGHWRGVYLWLFDTSNPALTPWEMLGYTSKPIWWESQYGAAPYTSTNDLLWNHLAAGFNYNNGASFIDSKRVRPGMRQMLPVNEKGELLSPLDTVVVGYDRDAYANREWTVGDFGPAEYAYFNSSSYRFDMTAMILFTSPAKFFGLGFDIDAYTFNSAINQYTNRSNTRAYELQEVKYGTGISQQGYIAWLIDYSTQFGIDAVEKLQNIVNDVDVRLAYRMAGFSDKNMLKCYVEKASPNSTGKSLLIPDDNFSIIVNENPAEKHITFSSVIVNKTTRGYQVWGNSQYRAYFETVTGNTNVTSELSLYGITINLSKDYSNVSKVVPYGYEFTSIQTLCEFILNYGRKLDLDGMKFDQTIGGVDQNWNRMIAEVMEWTRTNWTTGSALNINPCAQVMHINVPGLVVRPLTYQAENFILNQRAMPIAVTDLAVTRIDTDFKVKALNSGDSLAFAEFNLSSIEHAIVFDNSTLFGDRIYEPVTGLRQRRIILSGTKSNDWNGTVNASGFIINLDNVNEWTSVKYPKGSIVKYKNVYWTASELIHPSEQFDHSKWIETEYASIQKGLLPNANTKSLEAVSFYDTTKPNLESDSDILSYSLIGYRSREYMASADLTDATQIGVFKNLTGNKGSQLSIDAFKNANLLRGEIDYTVHENWAIKTGEYGDEQHKFYTIPLSSVNKNNPAIIKLVDDESDGIHIRNMLNYSYPPKSKDLFQTTTITSEKTAGHVNLDQVDVYGYAFDEISPDVMVGQNIWIANENNNWNVYGLTPLSSLTDGEAAYAVYYMNNGDDTINLVMNVSIDIQPNTIILVNNFDGVNGYYRVISSDGNSVYATILSDITGSTDTGNGLVFILSGNRVETPSDIIDVDLRTSRFSNKRVWIDDNSTVVEKTVAYIKQTEMSGNDITTKFGTSVAVKAPYGIFVGDPENKTVYRYTISGNFVSKTISALVDFGKTLTITNDGILFVGSSTNVSIMMVVDSVQLAQPILLTQTIDNGITTPLAMAISGDNKWLYVSYDNNTVRSYSRAFDYTRTLQAVTPSVAIAAGQRVLSFVGDVTATLTLSTTLSFGKNSPIYYIVSSVYSAPTNTTTVRLHKSITDYSIEGVYTAVPFFVYQKEITSVNGFGKSIATNFDGSKLVVGSPTVDFDGSNVNTGVAHVYANPKQRFEITVDGVNALTLHYTPTANPIIWVNSIETVNFMLSTNVVSIEVNAGDIVEVMGGSIVLTDNFNPHTSQNVNNGIGLGTAVAINNSGNTIAIGAPGKVNNSFSTGKVYRLDNSFKDIGYINWTGSSLNVLINGVYVALSGSITSAVLAINQAKINNIVAYAVGSKIAITAKDASISKFQSLVILNALTNGYTLSDEIIPPDSDANTGFGITLIIDNKNSLIVGAPYMNRLSDSNFNDVYFDSNATQFIDYSVDTGTVFVYDDFDKYVFGQALYSASIQNSRYGSSIASDGNSIVVGSTQNTATVFNSTVKNWNITNVKQPIVDLSLVKSLDIWDIDSGIIDVELDIIDPLNGAMLKVVADNIDYQSSYDPAQYSISNNSGIKWGSESVGKMWFNTKNVQWIDCKLNDLEHSILNWGKVIDGSSVEVYTWVSSNVKPETYTGIVYSNNYSESSTINGSGKETIKYYFWAKNTDSIVQGKTLTDSVLEQYITNPINSGIAFAAIVDQSTVVLYNSSEYVDGNKALNVNLKSAVDNFNVEYALIKTDSDDFLSGFTTVSGQYAKMIDSFAGTDVSGRTVPDINLPMMARTGISNNPRKSWFKNRLEAVRNYVGYVNTILVTIPITESKTFPQLFKKSDITTVDGINTYAYDTTQYWEYATWWDIGYDSSTRISNTVKKYADLLKLKTTEGMVVTVLQNSSGNKEFYTFKNSEWIRVGLVNGTIQFKSSLWDYSSIGFDSGIFGDLYDYYPSIETRNVIRSINEEIFTEDMSVHRNTALIKLFEYIQSEGTNDWLTKTSLVDVSHVAGKLFASQKYQRDSRTFLEGYLNEVKPYHVVIKDFQFKYTGSDVYQSTSTDFDLPAKYNPISGKFESPELVYSGDGNLPSDTIWNDGFYKDWKANYGIKLSGIKGYAVAKVAEYVSTKSTSIFVDNAIGLPIAGVMKLHDELITYTIVNRLTGEITGLGRGYNGSRITDHRVETSIVMDLDGATLIYGGRGYITKPRVTVTLPMGLPLPSVHAQFKPELANGQVVKLTTLNVSSGYAATPSIDIAPAFTVTLASTSVNSSGNTMVITTNTPFINGDQVKYVQSGDYIGLLDQTWYYVGVIDETFNGTYTQVISLYSHVSDVLSDHDRIKLVNATVGTHQLQQGARAIAMGKVNPIRTNLTSIKFDRTSFKTKITEWKSGAYYAGSFENTMKRLGNMTSNSSLLSSVDIYSNIAVTQISSTGIGAMFTVLNSKLGAINTENYHIDIVNAGTGYKVDDIIFVSGSSIGGANIVNDVTIVVEDITVLDVPTSSGSILKYSTYGNSAKIGTLESINYTNVATTNLISSGTGCIVNVIRMDQQVPPANTYWLSTSWTGGSGYNINDTLSIPGTLLGGTSPDNDAVIIVTGVAPGGSISSATIDGSGIIATRVNSINQYSMSAGHVIVNNMAQNLTTLADVVYTGGLNPVEINNEKMFFYDAPRVYSNMTAVTSVFGSAAKFKVSTPVFNPTTVVPQYNVELDYISGIEQCGTGYKTGQVLKILGSSLGGTSPKNDLFITVQYVYSGGRIGAVTCFGIANANIRSHYVKVINDTQIELYQTPTFTGYVDLTDEFDTFNLPLYGFIPHFAFYEQNMVLFDNQLYLCTESNNDLEFIETKWTPLLSGDSRLNALDRIMAFYSPTVGMPGREMTQLLEGITYQNSVYHGNPFDSTMLLDNTLKGDKFSNTLFELVDFTVAGNNIYAVSENHTTVSLVTNKNFIKWDASKNISPVTLGITSIHYDGQYKATTISDSAGYMSSVNGINWSQTVLPITNAQCYLHDIVVGDGIAQKSTTWNKVFDFNSELPNTLKSIKFIDSVNFTGYIAVGSGYELVDGIAEKVGRIVFGILDLETNTIVWTLQPSVTSFSLNDVTTDGTIITVVGENGIVLTSSNGGIWQTTTVGTITFNSIVYHDKFVAVGDDSSIWYSVDSITWSVVTLTVSSNFTKIKYFDKYIVVGSNKTIGTSLDGMVWDFVIDGTTGREAYDIVGDTFDAGYSPEEMISGVISESIRTVVTARPSGDFDGYQSVFKANGFNMKQHFPHVYDNSVSFEHVTPNPMALQVYAMDENGLGRRMQSTEYVVDWKFKIITFVNAFVNEYPMVEVYEPGNGNILKKSNSNITKPIGNIIKVGLPITSQINTLHPVYKNGIEQFVNVDYTINADQNGIMQFTFNTALTEDDYIAYAIMGQATAEVQEYRSLGISPQSFTIESGLSESFNSDSGLVYIQDPETMQWLSIDTANWSILGNTVTITDPLVILDSRVRITRKTYNSVTVVSSNSNNIAIPQELRVLANKDSLAVYKDGVLTPDWSFDDVNKTAITVSAGGTFYEVKNVQFSMPEIIEFVATSGQTVFTFTESLSTTSIDNAIVTINGLRVIQSTYTFTIGSITFASPLTLNDKVSILTYHNVRNQYLVTSSGTKSVSIIDNVTVGNSVQITVPNGHGLVNNDVVYIDGFIEATSLRGEFVVKNLVVSGGFTQMDLYQKDSNAVYQVSPLGVNASATNGLIWKKNTFQISTAIDVTRLFVTVNGKRVHPSKLKIYGNNLGIMMSMTNATVIITETSQKSTPNEIIYMQLIDKLDTKSVYRIPSSSQTWIKTPVNENDNIINVDDVTALVDTITVESIVTNSKVELTTDRNLTTGAMIYNKSVGQWVVEESYSIELINLTPTVIFTNGVSDGDVLQVTAFVGNTAYISGEIVKFNQINFTNDYITGLTRGASISPRVNADIGTIVYGITPANKLPDDYLNSSWNSTDYNIEDVLGNQMGDPLSLSTTNAAKFLQQ